MLALDWFIDCLFADDVVLVRRLIFIHLFECSVFLCKEMLDERSVFWTRGDNCSRTFWNVSDWEAVRFISNDKERENRARVFSHGLPLSLNLCLLCVWMHKLICYACQRFFLFLLQWNYFRRIITGSLIKFGMINKFWFEAMNTYRRLGCKNWIVKI